MIVIGYGGGDYYINTAVFNFLSKKENMVVWISPSKPHLFKIKDCKRGEYVKSHNGNFIWFNSTFENASKSVELFNAIMKDLIV